MAALAMAVLAAVPAITAPVRAADPLAIVTWNARQFDGTNHSGEAFRAFIGEADVVVLQEVPGEADLRAFMGEAGIGAWSFAISDFSRDDLDEWSSKLEVAILSPHRIGSVIEVDPWPYNDTEAMAAQDSDLPIPDFMPPDQRETIDGRGWLWAELPDLDLAVAAVHLKSSRGQTGRDDEENAFKREAVASALAVTIRDDALERAGWSYVVAGDFNVAPGDTGKVGVDLALRCPCNGACTRYDQTHALLGGGLVSGLAMRNLTLGLSSSYAPGGFVSSPIDNIYAMGPAFDRTRKLTVELGDHFGSDHFSIRAVVVSE
ncbi:MAG: endonuclease/exonuclease/phosphatase family protein [Rhodospirillales bacterium]|nr:endonuclease/exonuclease/phosphatase family protein [Rhodospirillales bacterium]